jgi:hypothetical protein
MILLLFKSQCLRKQLETAINDALLHKMTAQLHQPTKKCEKVVKTIKISKTNRMAAMVQLVSFPGRPTQEGLFTFNAAIPRDLC